MKPTIQRLKAKGITYKKSYDSNSSTVMHSFYYKGNEVYINHTKMNSSSGLFGPKKIGYEVYNDYDKIYSGPSQEKAMNKVVSWAKSLKIKK